MGVRIRSNKGLSDEAYVLDLTGSGTHSAPGDHGSIAISVGRTYIDAAQATPAIPFDNSADAQPALSSLIDNSESGGVIVLPVGTARLETKYDTNHILSYNPAGGALTLQGQGCGQSPGSTNAPRTTLYVPTDIGGRVLDISVAAQWNGVEDLKILGPGAEGNSGILGSSPSTMDGICFASLSYIKNVVISGGFHAGLLPFGNHARLYNVRSGSGNRYGIYYSALPWTQGNGDNFFVGCDFTGCTMASIGINWNSEFSGEYMLETHLGFAPYGIYKEAGGTSHPNMIVNVDATHSSIEGVGNAAFYDDTGVGVIASCRWRGGMTIDATYRYATDGLRRGWMDVSEMRDCTLDLGTLAYLPQYASGSAAHIWLDDGGYGNTIRVGDRSVAEGGQKIGASTLPFLGGSLSIQAPTNILIDGRTNAVARLYELNGNCTRRQVMELLSATHLQARTAVSASGKPLAGLAAQTLTGSSHIFCWESGALYDGGFDGAPIADSTIAIGDKVTPDGVGTAGRVKTVATPASDRVLGVSIGAPTVGVVDALLVRLGANA